MATGSNTWRVPLAQTLIELEPGGFLEGVDGSVLIGAQSQGNPGPGEDGKGPDSIAEIGFGGGACAHGRSRVPDQVEVGGIEVDAVNAGGARGEGAGVGEDLGRRGSETRPGLSLARPLVRPDGRGADLR